MLVSEYALNTGTDISVGMNFFEDHAVLVSGDALNTEMDIRENIFEDEDNHALTPIRTASLASTPRSSNPPPVPVQSFTPLSTRRATPLPACGLAAGVVVPAITSYDQVSAIPISSTSPSSSSTPAPLLPAPFPNQTNLKAYDIPHSLQLIQSSHEPGHSVASATPSSPPGDLQWPPHPRLLQWRRLGGLLCARTRRQAAVSDVIYGRELQDV